MTSIVFTGLSESSLAFLQNQLLEMQYTFVEIKEKQAKEKQAAFAGTAAVYLIGEKVENPIRLAQTVYALDPQLSVIILNEHQNFLKIKQALLFTPFIGNNVCNISTEVSSNIGTATQEAISRTAQRRQYLRMKALPSPVVQPNTPVYEDIKSEYLDKFLQEAPIGAVLLTDKGSILAINNYALKILSLTEKQLIGTPFAHLFDTVQQQSLYRLMDSISNNGTIEQTLVYNTRRGSQTLNLRLAQINIKSNASYSLAILTDITNIVSAQQKVEQQVEELKEVNEQLKQANADLDAFVYTASHDLKAPIANIEGLITLIKGNVGSPTPQLDTLFSMVEVSIQRFMGTIKDLTEVALIQKRGQGDQKVHDALEVIQEVQTLIREMIVSADAKIEVECSEGYAMNISRSNFRSIVYNLLSNAIKYRSAARRPCIRISLSKQPGFSLLSVEDNGLGIPADKQDKIFHMFKRVHSHVDGSGIGLFIVKRIVDSTHSKIEVESTEGTGSTFRVYLRDYKE